MLKKGWSFPSSCGFTGSAGKIKVRGYMRGGVPKAPKLMQPETGTVDTVKPKTIAQMLPGRQTPMRKQDIMRKAGFSKKPLIGG